MFKYINLSLKTIFILFFLSSSSYCVFIEKIEKFDPLYQIHAAIDLLISTENSGPIEIEEIRLWLEKNLEELKPHINSSFADLTLLERYFRKYPPMDLLEFSIWKILIKMGANPNTIIKYSNPFKDIEYSGSLLHYCAMKNDLDSAKLLIEHNINVDLQDSSERTALHVAILNDSQDIINFLIINCKANLDTRDSSLKTPLHLAVETNNIKTIELLKIWGASLKIKGFRKKTPLEFAVEQKNLEAIRILNPILYEKITKKKPRNCDII